MTAPKGEGEKRQTKRHRWIRLFDLPYRGYCSCGWPMRPVKGTRLRSEWNVHARRVKS